MAGKEIKVVCKRCGKPVPMDKIILDNVYKMMVCQICVAERKEKEKSLATQALRESEGKTEMNKKPADWDYEDAYLEEASKQNKRMSTEMIDDTKIKCVCHKCKYHFVYDKAKKHPKACPYCATDVILK